MQVRMDLRAEPREGLPKLAANGAAANDGHRRGQLLQREDLLVPAAHDARVGTYRIWLKMFLLHKDNAQGDPSRTLAAPNDSMAARYTGLRIYCTFPSLLADHRLATPLSGLREAISWSSTEIKLIKLAP
eukprot:6174419-Pleurochrysis_carterae.AAC.2